MAFFAPDDRFFVNTLNPALVTARAAQRLPRWALLLLCGAYLLPGLFGRDPWKNADITAFGYMMSLAQGDSPWWAPTLGGVPSDAALLPYWLGAVFIQTLGPWVEPALAARIPFALLLGAVMGLTWYGTFYLARTGAAQPLPFAFGGEAKPIDYARAIADGGLLALMASLGLLQLGHETTPELCQLTGVALWTYAMASRSLHPKRSALAMLLCLPIMAASGAPGIALLLCGLALITGPYRVGAHTCILVSSLLSVLIALKLHAYSGELTPHLPNLDSLLSIARQWLWFLWPTWPLVLWTLWHWRTRLLEHHVLVPLGCSLVVGLTSVIMGGHDRTLMLALPTLAILAAFALPTLGRSTAAAIDWFSVFFFTSFALGLWVMYLALHTGFPTKPAANMVRLAAGFEPQFSPWSALLALSGTLAWCWLVRWRTGENRHPLWKSLVLPASGVALCWLMVMTLWLPLLDYRRSYRPLIERIQTHVPPDQCVAALNLERAQVAALIYFGRYNVDANATSTSTSCPVLMQKETRSQPLPDPPGWRALARVHRPADKNDITVIYRRKKPL
jgi:4-amino-4-deoxy-L-arabinose transferase-like glycosyltransferase